ncbi:hypothetical protein [Streptomyces albogriseolus]
MTGRYFEDNQKARLVTDEENPTGGVAAHAVDPRAADRFRGYATEALCTP